MKKTKACLALCLISALTDGIPSQAVIMVGPGGLPDVGAALAVAAPGDRIHVQPGSYPGFAVNLGVTIRAIGQGTVTFGDLFTGLSAAIPVGQALHLVDCTFARELVVTAGRVTFDGCRFLSAARLDITDASVHLQRTGIYGAYNSPARIRCVRSDLTAVQCGVGYRPSSTNTDVGISAYSSRVHLSHCNILAEFSMSGLAIRASAQSIVWAADCTLTTNQACTFENHGSIVRLSRCQVIQIGNPICPTPATGGELLSAQRTTGMTLGSPLTLTFRSAAGSFVSVFAAHQLGTVDWGPTLEQPSWLDESNVTTVALLLADSGGNSTVTWQLPANPVFVDLPLWFKGIAGPTLPLQVSPPVGGILR